MINFEHKKKNQGHHGDTKKRAHEHGWKQRIRAPTSRRSPSLLMMWIEKATYECPQKATRDKAIGVGICKTCNNLTPTKR